MNYGVKTLLVAIGAAAMLVPGVGAAAENAADYFKGRTINIIVGFGPSGGYALYCRQLTTYWPKYIPGNPTVLCQFMPGGGGVKAANYMYNVAPRDGSTLSMISDYAAVAQLMQPNKIKYDIREFRWVGIMVPSNPVLAGTNVAKVQKFDDLFKHELALGVTGRLAQSGINASLMNKMLGTKIKIIAGYPSTGKVALAMEGNEVEATMSSWISLKARLKQKFESGKFIPLVQVGYKKAWDLPNVPLMRDQAKNEKARKVLDLASGAAPFGRSVSVPPGFPVHLLAALRTAFDKTMEDKEFRATAKKRNIEIDPSPGASLDEVVKDLLSTPPEIVKIAQEAAGIKN
jgi:tripartite-type tricarboxylate transporter receptor subunit TctC